MLEGPLGGPRPFAGGNGLTVDINEKLLKDGGVSERKVYIEMNSNMYNNRDRVIDIVEESLNNNLESSGYIDVHHWDSGKDIISFRAPEEEIRWKNIDGFTGRLIKVADEVNGRLSAIHKDKLLSRLSNPTQIEWIGTTDKRAVTGDKS